MFFFFFFFGGGGLFFVAWCVSSKMTTNKVVHLFENPSMTDKDRVDGRLVF